jgi:hypothetical protein
MKAVRIHDFGSTADVLQYEEVPTLPRSFPLSLAESLRELSPSLETEFRNSRLASG